MMVELMKRTTRRYIGQAVIVLFMLFACVKFIIAQQSTLTTKSSVLPDPNEIKIRQPHKRIAFLKSHKCGSSTITHILVAFGWKHNLNIATPLLDDQNDFNYPRKFSKSLVRPSAQPYDMVFHHTRYSHQMKQIMPSDTFFFTIIRDPVSQLQSSYSFYNFARYVEAETGHKNLSFMNFVLSNKSPFEGPKGLRVFNRQMFDLGLDYPAMTDERQIMQKIEEIDRDFHFVAVTEFFNEGLILLRDQLGWDMKDIMHFQNKVRTKKTTTISDSDAKQIRSGVERWNKADTLLYRHFKRKLEERIRPQELYIREEVKKLKELQERWSKVCVNGKVLASADGDDCRYQSPYDSMIFNVTESGKQNATCLLLTAMQKYLALTTNIMMKTKVQDPTYSLRSGYDLIFNGNVSCIEKNHYRDMSFNQLAQVIKDEET